MQQQPAAAQPPQQQPPAQPSSAEFAPANKWVGEDGKVNTDRVIPIWAGHRLLRPSMFSSEISGSLRVPKFEKNVDKGLAALEQAHLLSFEGVKECYAGRLELARDKKLLTPLEIDNLDSHSARMIEKLSVTHEVLPKDPKHAIRISAFWREIYRAIAAREEVRASKQLMWFFDDAPLGQARFASLAADIAVLTYELNSSIRGRAFGGDGGAGAGTAAGDTAAGDGGSNKRKGEPLDHDGLVKLLKQHHLIQQDGNVFTPHKRLQDAIECGAAWRKLGGTFPGSKCAYPKALSGREELLLLTLTNVVTLRRGRPPCWCCLGNVPTEPTD